MKLILKITRVMAFVIFIGYIAYKIFVFIYDLMSSVITYVTGWSLNADMELILTIISAVFSVHVLGKILYFTCGIIAIFCDDLLKIIEENEDSKMGKN